MNIGKVGKSTGVLRCPRCLRDKEKAIKMQVQSGCSCNDDKCAFINEIQEALVESKLSVYCINCGTKYLESTDNFCYICGYKKVKL